MKKTLIFIFIINIYSPLLHAQVKKDSVVKTTIYGLRLGVDVSKPIIGLFDKQNKSLELNADIRVANNYYVAFEIGNTTKTSNEDYINFTTKGNYLTTGINYNAYKNWIGMRNEIFVGFRYGIATFSQTLNSYTPNINGTYFNTSTLTPNTKFSGLNMQWIAIVFGMKIETFKNLFLSSSVSFNKKIASKEPDNFKNLYAPGFGRVFLNDAGVSFNYSISYLIPLKKRKK